jgi:Flp pilus assembly protein TadB
MTSSIHADERRGRSLWPPSDVEAQMGSRPKRKRPGTGTHKERTPLWIAVALLALAALEWAGVDLEFGALIIAGLRLLFWIVGHWRPA